MFEGIVVLNIVNSGVPNPIFMQDNFPCHKTKAVLSYFEQQDLEVMGWLPQSPDINPIENLWKTLGVKVMARNPIYMEYLWMKLQEELARSTWLSYKKNLCLSFGRYCMNGIFKK